LPKFQRGAFVIFLVALLLSAILADQPAGRALLFDPAAFARAEALWAPFTASFIFAEGELFGLAGTLVVQWLLGSLLEGFWGTRRYLLFAIGCGLAGYLVLGLLGLLLPAVREIQVAGTTAIDLSAVVAFGVVFGRRQLNILGLLPLSSRGLALLICCVALVAPLARGAPWPKVVPWAVSMLVALLVTTQPWRRLASSGKLGGRGKARKRSHLQVVKPDKSQLN
jgi:membrane associated rhomboid family serine protease